MTETRTPITGKELLEALQKLSEEELCLPVYCVAEGGEEVKVEHLSISTSSITFS